MTNPLKTIAPDALDRVHGGNWVKWGKKTIEWTGALLRAWDGHGPPPKRPILPPPERPAIIDTRPPPPLPKLPGGVKIDLP